MGVKFCISKNIGLSAAAGYVYEYQGTKTSIIFVYTVCTLYIGFMRSKGLYSISIYIAAELFRSPGSLA